MAMTFDSRTARNWRFRAGLMGSRGLGTYSHSIMNRALAPFGSNEPTCHQDWMTRCRELLRITASMAEFATVGWGTLIPHGWRYSQDCALIRGSLLSTMSNVIAHSRFAPRMTSRMRIQAITR